MKPKLLMLILDGARYDKLRGVHTPHLDELACNGVWGPSWIHDNDLGPTLSGNGHASILTGVWSDKHHSWDNDFEAINLDAYPSIFTRMAHERPELRTFSSISWEPLDTHLIGETGVKLLQRADSIRENDIAGILAAQDAMRSGADALYVYLLEGDEDAHSHGVESPEYVDALEHMDQIIGTLLETVRQQPADENWLILVSTDHGMTGFDHGGDEYTSRLGWVLASGPSVSAESGQHEWKIVDIAVSALTHMGIEIDPLWELDGAPIAPRTPGAFDELTERLENYDPLPGLTLPGQTPDVPAEWSRASEGPGWQFMTGHYWSWRLPSDGRGSFVRARGVIAVCDPMLGETPAPIDSTLWSPFLEHGSTHTVFFHNHYRQSAGGHQRASVIAELTDGQETTIWSRDFADGQVRDTSTLESLELPELTTRIGWRFESETASGYWAIDAPTIESNSERQR